MSWSIPQDEGSTHPMFVHYIVLFSTGSLLLAPFFGDSIQAPLVLILSLMGFSTIILALHTKGWRRANWRMFPNVVAILLVLISVSFDIQSLLVNLLALSLALLSILLFIIVPTPSVPKTSGVYDSSTTGTVWTYVDPHSGETTRMPIQLWYPSLVKKGTPSERATLWTTGTNEQDEIRQVSKYLAERGAFPAFLTYHFEAVLSASFKHKDIANGTFPLIVMSHGLYGWKSCQSFICEELASHGYIVVAPDHIPDNICTVFPDGETKEFAYHLPKGVPPASEQERAFYNKQIQTRYVQMQTCINNCIQPPESVRRNSLVSSILSSVDSGKIGVIGHSYGGGTCVVTAHRDPRIKATVALDSWMFPLADEEREPTKSNSPVLFISGDG
jgi:dienelactone hydrolase